MKEFGYQVSKDYEKLWKLLDCNKSVCFIKFGGERIPCFYEDRSFLYHTETTDGELHRKEFIDECERLCLTFIDPNPPNQNAIYYKENIKRIRELIEGLEAGEDVAFFKECLNGILEELEEK